MSTIAIRLQTGWHRIPVTWRRALLATTLLWMATMAVVIIAAGTLPVRETVDVGPSAGFGGWPAPPTDATGGELVATGLVRFDALWYLAIAADGYPTTVDVPQAAAFFPGYPLLVAAIGWLLGGRLVLAAHLLSFGACVVALAGLQRLAEMVVDADPSPPRLDRDDVASRTVLLTAAFPTAFFLVAPYAEALFLASAVWALVEAARGRPWTSAGLTAVATLVRPVGVLLVVPLLLGVVAGHGRGAAPGRRGTGSGDEGLAARVMARIVPASGAAVACAAIAAHGYAQWRDPLAVVHAQESWQRGLTAPWDSAWWAIRFALEDLGGGFTGYHLLDLVVVGAVLLGVAALVRRRQWPLVAHAAANVLLWLTQPFPSRPLLSAPRFALVVPGVVLGLAIAIRTTTRERVWLPISAGLLVLHLALFTRWWFVF